MLFEGEFNELAHPAIAKQQAAAIAVGNQYSNNIEAPKNTLDTIMQYLGSTLSVIRPNRSDPANMPRDIVDPVMVSHSVSKLRNFVA